MGGTGWRWSRGPAGDGARETARMVPGRGASVGTPAGHRPTCGPSPGGQPRHGASAAGRAASVGRRWLADHDRSSPRPELGAGRAAAPATARAISRVVAGSAGQVGRGRARPARCTVTWSAPVDRRCARRARSGRRWRRSRRRCTPGGHRPGQLGDRPTRSRRAARSPGRRGRGRARPPVPAAPSAAAGGRSGPDARPTAVARSAPWCGVPRVTTRARPSAGDDGRGSARRAARRADHAALGVGDRRRSARRAAAAATASSRASSRSAERVRGRPRCRRRRRSSGAATAERARRAHRSGTRPPA